MKLVEEQFYRSAVPGFTLAFLDNVSNPGLPYPTVLRLSETEGPVAVVPYTLDWKSDEEAIGAIDVKANRLYLRDGIIPLVDYLEATSTIEYRGKPSTCVAFLGKADAPVNTVALRAETGFTIMNELNPPLAYPGDDV